MFEWKHTKFGHELINVQTNEQIALLKYDEIIRDYYISCIRNEVIEGRLQTNDLDMAKQLTAFAVSEHYHRLIIDYTNIVRELNKLVH